MFSSSRLAPRPPWTISVVDANASVLQRRSYRDRPWTRATVVRESGPFLGLRRCCSVRGRAPIMSIARGRHQGSRCWPIGLDDRHRPRVVARWGLECRFTAGSSEVAPRHLFCRAGSVPMLRLQALIYDRPGGRARNQRQRWRSAVARCQAHHAPRARTAPRPSTTARPNSCPNCGYPSPDFRESCRDCGYPHGRA